MAQLSDLKRGESGRVAGYADGGRAYRKKLLSMGLTPGAEFKVTRCAPMGDPVEIDAAILRREISLIPAATWEITGTDLEPVLGSSMVVCSVYATYRPWLAPCHKESSKNNFPVLRRYVVCLQGAAKGA